LTSSPAERTCAAGGGDAPPLPHHAADREERLKAKVQLDEFRRRFGALRHGKLLAGTVGCLSVLSVLAIGFVAGVAHDGAEASGHSENGLGKE
jgi:hypothetical protein